MVCCGDLTWTVKGATSWRPPALLCGHRQSHECPALRLRAVIQQARGCVPIRCAESSSQLAPPPATDLSVITAAVSKEVAVTVKELLEQHREHWQEMALLQAALALQTAQQAAQMYSCSTASSTAGSSTDSRA